MSEALRNAIEKLGESIKWIPVEELAEHFWQAATQEKLPPEICKEGHPVACFQVVEEHHSFHSCAWCADKAKLQEEMELLRKLQIDLITAECGKCGRSLAPDGDCHGCRADKLEVKRGALRKVVELVACGDKDRGWEVSTAKYLIAKAEAALKEDQHG